MSPQHVVYFAVVAGVLSHLALRMVAVVRKARRRPRGAIHGQSLFGRMIGAYLVLFSLAAWEGWTSPSQGWILPSVGIAFYLLSCAMQWKALADLGAAYSPDIELRKEQLLVQSGMYSWIRHPLLVSGVLETLGMTLALGAPFTTILSATLFVAVIYQRWQEEEKALIAHFGDAYLAYRERVGAFFPRVGSLVR